jgi:alpha-glucosidase
MKNVYQYFIYCSLFLFLIFPSEILANVERLKLKSQDDYLVVEFLDDDLIHFEYGRGIGPSTDQPITHSDMVCNANDNVPTVVCKTDFSGPMEFHDHGDGVFETQDLRVEINPASLFVTIIDKTKNQVPLTTIRPVNLHQNFKGLIATRSAELDVYGLGQQFVEPGNSDIDWDGRVREGGDFGNIMASFNGGANGNTQIPVMYAANGATFDNYALFLDNTYKQRWDFTSTSQWKVEMFGDQIRFYIMTGPNLPDLRRDYMDLVGHPLVPPKKMLGLWVSEYGYDNWAELEGKLSTLRANAFPVDGFVLDLQWFGGITGCSDQTNMGRLRFDQVQFPDPIGTIRTLRDQEGLGLMLIEEAYVGKALPEHADLQGRGCLVQDHPGGTTPTYLTSNCWWGKGGMLDYTNDACGAYWHDTKRQPLIDQGIIGHWTDLGEPEMFNPGAGYAVGTHAEAHNIFNFRWLRGIYQGYVRHHVAQRPFMMSRSGTAGLQRFGAAMWSGDIGARLSSLAAHAANQMHMSFSGIDYYGADIGGFHRNLEGDLNEMYTQWYGYGMMFDIPGRPHVENLCNCKETAPDRIGNLVSNRENTRLRYQFVPYVYSLAHRAYRFGEPVMPPLVFYYQDDNNVRHMGHEKMIGRDLLAAMVAKYGEVARDVYLPPGTWVDYYTHQRIHSIGQWLPDVPVFHNGMFRLPLYAREGAIIPVMFVDEQTRNVLGQRSDGSVHDELIVQVFAFDLVGDTARTFTLFEDDGETIAYQQGQVRTTAISQQRTDNRVTVTVQGAAGTYAGAPDARRNVIELVVDHGVDVETVTLNGGLLPAHATLAAFDAADAGWINAGHNTIRAKSPVMPVASPKAFVFTLHQSVCASTFGAISVPGAGNGWNPADPVRIFTCDQGRTWSGRLMMCHEAYKFAADGSWKVNWGADGQPDGPNFPPLSEAGIFDVSFNEQDPAHPVFTPVNLDPALCGISARFVCDQGHTTFGTSVYVLGNIPKLGAWQAGQAVKLEPDGPYPRWTGVIKNLPANRAIEWKCVKRLETGGPVLEWEPGSNHTFMSPATGSAGEHRGAF